MDFRRLFPQLPGPRTGPVDLEAESVRWREAHRGDFPAGGPNPLLDPRICQGFIDGVHRGLGLDWSYGGYLEDRSRLWAGSYMDAVGNYLHLGVDFHVPVGTPVAAPVAATVMMVDDDHDTDGGWGIRVFVQPSAPALSGVVLVFAHLRGVRCPVGTVLAPGTVLAEVGGPPSNGNWPPHLHIQAVAKPYFEEILLDRFQELDGYGPADQREKLARLFPDPLALLFP